MVYSHHYLYLPPDVLSDIKTARTHQCSYGFNVACRKFLPCAYINWTLYSLLQLNSSSISPVPLLHWHFLKSKCSWSEIPHRTPVGVLAQNFFNPTMLNLCSLTFFLIGPFIGYFACADHDLSLHYLLAVEDPIFC